MSAASSNPVAMPGIQEIVELAKLLRQNGDKVLNSTSKLSLSTTLLHNLNQVFHSIVNESEDFESSFQVCNSSKNDVFRDVKFLHDFVQKTIGLKITCDLSDAKFEVDISKFRHLKYLELQKVCIQLTKGIQCIRGQLESVICAGGRGVSSIGDLLAACGGDACVGFVWNSLTQLSLPYNALTGLDKSLELTPWLQMLDLSHNLISKASDLDCLPSLKYVNLGYNKLESVPPFHKATFNTLQKLILKNNYIENINGLQGLENLLELDLSYNCLTEHYNLWPLETLSGLLWVLLDGNPISYHPHHRLLSLKHLHPCLSGTKFVLDRLPLTKTEKMLVAENRGFPIRPIGSVPRDYFSSISDSTSEHSSNSLNTSSYDESSNKKHHLDTMDSLDTSVINMTKSRKKQIVKEAIIDDDDEDHKKSRKSVSLSSSFLESSMDHLETKRQILALRKKFGEDHWLSNRAGTAIQNIMGLEIIADVLPSSSPSPSIQIDSAQSSNEDETKNETKNKTDETLEEQNFRQSEHVNLDLASIEANKRVRDSEPVYNPEEELGDLYLVQKKKNDHDFEEVFLIVTPEEVKERDSITGKLKFRWSTNTVLSCVMGRGTSTTVDIIFDTTRKDRQTRTYLVETDDARKIVETLSETIRTRSIELKVFKCMRCSTHFSHDTEISTVSMLPGLGPPKCPTCQSSLVIRTDDLNTPTSENSESNQLKHGEKVQKDVLDTNLIHSESQSSIGSAASLEDSRESTPSGGTTAKKSESDIEVLSNPSQSSIEVLDDVSRSNLTPNRKRSVGQRNVVAPSILTSDTAPIMAGLTESSSSGSMTDSVCTAYENKSIKLCDISEKSQNNDNVESEVLKNIDIEKEPVTNLTSMLGELLQTMKIGSTKTSPIKLEESSEFMRSDVRYSYTDFNSVDHRIKLHIILNIFEQEKEELVLLLRAEMLAQTSAETFPGCLVLSTSKIYVLRIIGPEGEDPQRWIRKETSWTMDRLRSFAPLPFKQGLLVQLEIPNKSEGELQNCTLVCILQDFQRTSSFLFYLTELHLPGNCEVEFTVPDYCNSSIKSVLSTSKNHREGDPVRLLAMFSSAVVKLENGSTKLNISGLVSTSSALIMLEDNLQWLLPDKKAPSIAVEQALNNLIAVDVEVDSNVESGNATLNLSFLDEMAGVEENWILDFVSIGAAESVVNSIQSPWEELFSVPLQINTRILDAKNKH